MENESDDTSSVVYDERKIKNFKKKRNSLRRKLIVQLIEHNLQLPILEKSHNIMILYLDAYMKELYNKHEREKQNLQEEWINIQNMIGKSNVLSDLENQLKIRQEERLQYKQQRESLGFQELWYDVNQKISKNWTEYEQCRYELMHKLDYFHPAEAIINNTS